MQWIKSRFKSAQGRTLCDRWKQSHYRRRYLRGQPLWFAEWFPTCDSRHCGDRTIYEPGWYSYCWKKESCRKNRRWERSKANNTLGERLTWLTILIWHRLQNKKAPLTNSSELDLTWSFYFLVTQGGFEPPTLRAEIWYSIQLNYWANWYLFSSTFFLRPILNTFLVL